MNSRHDTERDWDKRLRIQTAGRENERGARFMPYEPTPYSVLERVAAGGFISPEDHVLDYGCGKGRAAFFLASEIGCRVTGIDRSEKLIAIAEENRAAFARPELVSFIARSAESYLPEEQNVFYFFNPFSEAVLDIVLRRILACRAEGENSRLIFYYPSDQYLIRLAAETELRLMDEINCRDLFDPNDSRERVLVFGPEAP